MIGAESITKMSPLEEDEGGNHVGGLVLPMCDAEGYDDINGLHNRNSNREIGPPMVIRDQGGLKLQGVFTGSRSGKDMQYPFTATQNERS